MWDYFFAKYISECAWEPTEMEADKHCWNSSYRGLFFVWIMNLNDVQKPHFLFHKGINLVYTIPKPHALLVKIQALSE